MMNRTLMAIHDRIDEEHFDNRMHAQDIRRLKERMEDLAARMEELERLWWELPVDTKRAPAGGLTRGRESAASPAAKQNGRSK